MNYNDNYTQDNQFKFDDDEIMKASSLTVNITTCNRIISGISCLSDKEIEMYFQKYQREHCLLTESIQLNLLFDCYFDIDNYFDNGKRVHKTHRDQRYNLEDKLKICGKLVSSLRIELSHRNTKKTLKNI